MKKYLFFLIVISLLAKEFPPGYTENSNVNVVSNFNKWKDDTLDLQLKENNRTVKLLQSQGKIQDEVLKQMYKDAEFRIVTQREELKNDLIRAKIYWYYHNNYRRYYYYDINWNVIYIN